MSTITWVRPSKTEIDMPSTFDEKALKALGWKKKKGPKPQAQIDLTSEQKTGD
jgi:hypothetical protein